MFDGTPVDRQALDTLTGALAHRGPNGSGLYTDGSVGLGHRRLSVLDLSQAGSQPMYAEDRSVVLVFNGEIYNFAEERIHLEQRGYTFHSRSDTEVLLHLYEEYGPSCVERLRGMFAFAVHDKKRNILFIARDRVGKKPLKYFRSGGVFAFASELKALRTLPQCPRGVDSESVHHFLTMMYVPAPQTGFAGIAKLPAAHTLTIDLQTGKETLERYWQLQYKTDDQRPLSEWKDRIRTTLEKSVRLRMVADVPLGVFLSGGLDSTTLVAVMSGLTDQPIKTFSIGTGEKNHNELPQAAQVARAFGTDHHPIIVQPDIVHLLPELVQAYEEPYSDPSAIPTYLIAREARSSVTVALNGDGGDENFAGYVRYPILLFSERWRRAPSFLHALARQGTNAFHALRNDTFSYRCRRFEHSLSLPWEERLLQYISFFTEEEKRDLYKGGFGQDFPDTGHWYGQRTMGARGCADDLLHKAMSMDMQTYLSDDLLPKVDIGTMAHGLEARSPFLDHHLLELTAQLPSKYQLRGRTTKWILREMVKDILPPDILQKRKTGFRLPLDRWFRTDLQAFVYDHLLETPPLFGEIFDPSRIRSFLDRYFASNVDYSDHVWTLLWLAEWMRQYAPDASSGNRKIV